MFYFPEWQHFTIAKYDLCAGFSSRSVAGRTLSGYCQVKSIEEMVSQLYSMYRLNKSSEKLQSEVQKCINFAAKVAR